MPPKRKYDGSQTRRITKWLRSVKPRTAVARRPARRFTSRSRLHKRSARNIGGRGKRTRRRYKGSSSFQKLTRLLAPVSSISYQVAGREQIQGVATAAVSSSGVTLCRWFTPQRASGVSLGYPIWLDVLATANAVNGTTRGQGFDDANKTHESLDFKFTTFGYKQSTKIVNQCNAQSILTYYVLEARRDIPIVVGEAAAVSANYDILTMLGKGFYTTALRSVGNSGLDAVALTPTTLPTSANEALVDGAYNVFDSGPFLHYFKVKQTRTVVLNAGDIKIFNLVNNRKIINRPALYSNIIEDNDSWLYQNNQPSFFCLAGAQFQLFKLQGTPMNSAATVTNVNLTSPAVDFVSSISYKYQAIVKEGGVHIRGPNYNLASMSDGRFMGEQTDTALTAANA